MEIHVKINDVRGQDEKGRHILWINDEDLRLWLEEHQQYVIQTILQPMLKHHPGKLQEIIDDPTMRTSPRKTQAPQRRWLATTNRLYRCLHDNRVRKVCHKMPS